MSMTDNTIRPTTTTDNNNTNTRDNVYGAVIITQSLQESSPGLSENSDKQLPYIAEQANRDSVCKLLSSTLTTHNIAIYSITQAKS